MNQWPRLSEQLNQHPRKVGLCQSCGSEQDIRAWQEHDDWDRPEVKVVFLCKACSDRLISPHPRLYRRVEAGEPFPGAMPCCEACIHAKATACGSPLLKANGGSGLKLSFPPPTSVHIDGRRDGKRFGEWRQIFNGPVECAGREAMADVSAGAGQANGSPG